MCNVAHANGVLLLDVGQKGALVVDLEVEDAVLVRQREGGAINGGRVAHGKRLKVQTVEWRQHGEFKLEGIVGREVIWLPCVPRVFRDGNAVRLLTVSKLPSIAA